MQHKTFLVSQKYNFSYLYLLVTAYRTKTALQSEKYIIMNDK